MTAYSGVETMIRIWLSVLAACLLAQTASAQSGDVEAGDDTFVAVYRPAASPLQGDFEYFMTCYGRMSASLDLLERIRVPLGGRVPVDEIRKQGMHLMNQAFAEPYEAFIGVEPGLDLFSGERARHRGRAIFDEVEGAAVDIQYGRFRDLGALPDNCMATSDRLLAVIAARTAPN